MATLSNLQRDEQVLSFLDMFREETHSIECPPGLVREYMVERGLIDWVPPIFGSNNQYSITDKGLKERDVLRNDIEEYKNDQRD